MKIKANDTVTVDYAKWVQDEGVFPTVDVLAEFRRAKDWIWVHRDEGRKFNRRFFDNWLSRTASDSYNPQPKTYIP